MRGRGAWRGKAFIIIIMFITYCLFNNYSDLEAIRLLQHQVIASEEILCIDVRRDFLLTDALREARKKKFDPRKPIKVL